MDGLTIGQLAKRAGVPTSTVRYYERAGLLTPDARTGGNYRAYAPHSLDRLKFIRTAQATGFSLGDIRELLSLTHSDDPPCGGLAAVSRNRLRDVRDRIRQLKHVERVLARSVSTCCSGDEPDLCEEITRLRGPAARPCKEAAGCDCAKIPRPA